MERKPPELHRGHRKRIRERYRAKGFESMDEREVLELILTYSIPRRDVNGTARRLIEKLGSLENVFSASNETLANEFGLSENTVSHIKLINDIRTKPLNFKKTDRVQLQNLLQAAEFCCRVMGDPVEETVMQAFLDPDGFVLDCTKIVYGTTDSAELPIAAIVADACEHGVKRVLIAHNHPSGLSAPSVSDVIATDDLKQALASHGIKLVEHMIVCRCECTAILRHQTLIMSGETMNATWKDE